MTLPIAKHLLSCTCALLLTAALSQTSDAGAFYYAGYGPSYYGSYYTGYAPSYYSPSYYGSYGVGYRGYGLWGTSYASYYAPSYSYSSYYGPRYAYYGSSCGVGCNTCGYDSCGYGGSSCGVGCSPCGPCGVSYGSCGSCCNSCGLVSCGGCGIACADGCGTGVSPSPSAQPEAAPNKPYTPPADSSDPSTFEPDPNGDREQFSPPTTPDGGSGEITPDFGNDSQFDREAQKPPVGEEEGAEATIEQRQPAPAEPGTAEEEEGQPESDNPPEPPAAEVEGPMVELPSTIATAASPARTRLNYTVRFFAPKVARVDIAPNRNWIPVETETKLAASR